MNSGNEVVIVGGGLQGLSIARSLAERGIRDVLVFERGSLCSGATAKSSGVVRAHYGVPSLAAMAWQSIQLLEQATEVLGTDVGFQQTGYLVGVGPENFDALHANTAMQTAVGIPVELLGHQAAADLCPHAYLEDFATFAYEPRGGHGDAYRTGMAYADAARRQGVRIQQHAAVAALTTGSDGRIRGVQLANGQHVSAGIVILAAGAWSVPLARTVGVDLPIRSQREQILLIDPGEDLGPVPVLSDLVTLQYTRPEAAGQLLFGNSDHSSPEYADPDKYGNRADAEFVDTAIDKLSHRYPTLVDPRVVSSYAGCYDVTPDFNPIIGPTTVDGLIICAGFSGHGFKISPAVGQLVTDLVHDDSSMNPLVNAEDFRFERFAEERPLTSPHPYTGAGQMR